jgi:DNA-binding CsgD family transcriptional regulator
MREQVTSRDEIGAPTGARGRVSEREEEDPAWSYLRQVPQDREYPFHPLRWERRPRGQARWLTLLEEPASPAAERDAPEVAEEWAREACLSQAEQRVLRLWAMGISQAETGRRLILRKATVAALQRSVRRKLADLPEIAAALREAA